MSYGQKEEGELDGGRSISPSSSPPHVDPKLSAALFRACEGGDGAAAEAILCLAAPDPSALARWADPARAEWTPLGAAAYAGSLAAVRAVAARRRDEHRALKEVAVAAAGKEQREKGSQATDGVVVITGEGGRGEMPIDLRQSC